MSDYHAQNTQDYSTPERRQESPYLKTWNNTAASFSISALITSQQIPKVRTDSGNVISFKRAPKVPLTNPTTTAEMSAVPSPVMKIPGTTRATMSKQTALKSQCTSSLTIESP